MVKAGRSKQLSFTMRNKVGLLSEISAVLSTAKVNIKGICAYEMDNKAYFMLSTDSNAKAKKTLAKLGAKVSEDDIVTVEMPNKVGELEKVAGRIAEGGIGIHYMYGTTGTGKSSTCVFKTVDDKKVIKLINK